MEEKQMQDDNQGLEMKLKTDDQEIQASTDTENITQEKQKPSSLEEEEKEQQPKPQKMDIIIFFLLLIPAIIKDVIEVILGLIPFINLFTWIFSFPFTAYIIFVSFLTGIRKDFVFIGQLIDILPFASILPVSTFTVIMCAIYMNTPKTIKQPIEKTIKKNI